MKRELKELVTRSMDGRTTEARDVAEWTADVASDLGGPDNLSTQKRTLLDLAARSKLQLDRIDAWLWKQPQLVNRRTKALHPVVVQRQALVTTLRGLLNDLGLERQARDVGTLESYISQTTTDEPDTDTADTGNDGSGLLSREKTPESTEHADLDATGNGAGPVSRDTGPVDERKVALISTEDADRPQAKLASPEANSTDPSPAQLPSAAPQRDVETSSTSASRPSQATEDLCEH